jgi:hypothetical protein
VSIAETFTQALPSRPLKVTRDGGSMLRNLIGAKGESNRAASTPSLCVFLFFEKHPIMPW